MADNWKDTVKVEEDKEKKRILELQQKIKEKKLKEEDLNENDAKKIKMLYHEQNEKLRNELMQYKIRIKKLLKQ